MKNLENGGSEHPDSSNMCYIPDSALSALITNTLSLWSPCCDSHFTKQGTEVQSERKVFQ